MSAYNVQNIVKSIITMLKIYTIQAMVITLLNY
ncbi:hypothetical protein NSTCB13_00474 [Nostoc sp. DSM 114160]|jgi:hypothetical protein